ncbi:uncharacterized protein RB166_015626 [Leptodactylus fuscus]|uniref:uncharacterized protein LOC142185435 n=1 Tax=Leptodactylus fuscus TaxID=238119 RepID=UPI003F4ED8DA
MEDIQWFYAKSKVPICLAITDSHHFLTRLKDTDILTTEEILELQGDTRTAHRVVYECLCCIEESNVKLRDFFKFLFHISFLKKYPDLKSIYTEYKEGKYKNGIQNTADEDTYPRIFAQEKVRICLSITGLFPFLYGLRDIVMFSESELLKLLADERPVSRVIYESLSLIEKKDIKLHVVFEYIFQECYQKLYPGLHNILKEPFDGPDPKFKTITDLSEFLKKHKRYICQSINERFPFLHGLRDFRLLSHIQFLYHIKKTGTGILSGTRTRNPMNQPQCHIKKPGTGILSGTRTRNPMNRPQVHVTFYHR